MNRGNARNALFFKEADYEAFERVIEEGLKTKKTKAPGALNVFWFPMVSDTRSETGGATTEAENPRQEIGSVSGRCG